MPQREYVVVECINPVRWPMSPLCYGTDAETVGSWLYTYMGEKCHIWRDEWDNEDKFFNYMNQYADKKSNWKFLEYRTTEYKPSSIIITEIIPELSKSISPWIDHGIELGILVIIIGILIFSSFPHDR